MCSLFQKMKSKSCSWKQGSTWTVVWFYSFSKASRVLWFHLLCLDIKGTKGQDWCSRFKIHFLWVFRHLLGRIFVEDELWKQFPENSKRSPAIYIPQLQNKFCGRQITEVVSKKLEGTSTIHNPIMERTLWLHNYRSHFWNLGNPYSQPPTRNCGRNE